MIPSHYYYAYNIVYLLTSLRCPCLSLSSWVLWVVYLWIGEILHSFGRCYHCTRTRYPIRVFLSIVIYKYRIEEWEEARLLLDLHEWINLHSVSNKRRSPLAYSWCTRNPGTSLPLLRFWMRRTRSCGGALKVLLHLPLFQYTARIDQHSTTTRMELLRYSYNIKNYT